MTSALDPGSTKWHLEWQVKWHYECHPHHRTKLAALSWPNLRDALQISPGDSLELESSEDRIILRPATGKGRIYKKQGMWVFDSNAGVPLSAAAVNRTIGRVRAERDRHVLGKYKK